METPIKIQIVKDLSKANPSRIVAVKKDGETSFSLYVTDINGVPFPIKNTTTSSGITSIVNTDGAIDVVGSSNIVVNLDSTLLATINSALQSGANISELVNDEGYIKLADIITNHSELTLDDGTNPHGTTKADVGLSNVPNLDTTSAIADSHTHSNKTILDLITEAFTTSLKSIYDATTSSLTSLLITGVRLITSTEITKLSNTSGVNTGDQDLSPYELLSNKKTSIVGNETSDTFYASIKSIYDWAVGKFQDILVSGTNIKTINGNSVLGSGDLVVSSSIPDATELISGIVNTTTQALAGNKSIKGESTTLGNALELKNSSNVQIATFGNNKTMNVSDGFIFNMIRTTSNVSDSPRFRFTGINIVAQDVYAEQGNIVFTGGIAITGQFNASALNIGNAHGTAAAPNIVAGNGIRGGIYLTKDVSFGTNIGFSTNDNANVAGTQKMLLYRNGALIIGSATTPQVSSIFQADSTTRGSLPFPRMTQAQKNAIATPAIGLHVYQTDATEGVYVYKSSGWTFAY